MKISFDFDGTLSSPIIQKYAKELIERGIEVYVTTSRFSNEEKVKRFSKFKSSKALTNDDLKKITDLVGIPDNRIHFTNMADKCGFIKNKGFTCHIDDDWIENDLIESETTTKTVNSTSLNWKEQIEKIIQKG